MRSPRVMTRFLPPKRQRFLAGPECVRNDEAERCPLFTQPDRNATYSNLKREPVKGAWDARRRIVRAADFNSDVNPDVVSQNKTSGLGYRVADEFDEAHSRAAVHAPTGGRHRLEKRWRAIVQAGQVKILTWWIYVIRHPEKHSH